VKILTVLYHNEKAGLLRSLRSIASALLHDQENARLVSECIVAWGDASEQALFSAEEVEGIRSELPGGLKLEYQFFAENTGTARGQNRLAENSSSDYLMIMNPDLLFSQRLFSLLLKPFLEGDGKVGIVEARQTPLEHPKVFDEFSGETSWAAGACFMTPALLYQELGGLDESAFFMYCDDVDYSWRVRLAGKQVLYQASAPVFHPKRITKEAKWVATKAEKYYTEEALLMMAYKWGHVNRWKRMLGSFERSTDENKQKAAQNFKQRMSKGTLPQQIAQKNDLYYCRYGTYTQHRFDL